MDEVKNCPFCGEEIKANAIKCKHCGEFLEKSTNGTDKKRSTTILLTIFLGGLGVHKFYLEQNTKGILYLLFSLTGIPALLCFIDFIKFIIWDDKKFQEYVLANRENSNNTQKKQHDTNDKTIGYYIACVFSILFFVTSIAQIFTGDYLTATIFFLFTLLTLPNFSNLLRDRYQFNFLAWQRIILSFIILVIYGCFVPEIPETSANNTISSQARQNTTQQKQKTNFKIGDEVKVGYLTYNVLNTGWRQRIGDKYFGTNANSSFLLVTISVRNDDNQSRMIPEFSLIDENGNKYETDSGNTIYLGDEGFLLDSLNPAVTKQGVILFDVPKGNNYKLVLSGGVWSTAETYVDLN